MSGEERPDANDRPCEDCGHIWFAGQRRHEYVDLEAGSDEQQAVLCLLCIQQRGLRVPHA